MELKTEKKSMLENEVRKRKDMKRLDLDDPEIGHKNECGVSPCRKILLMRYPLKKIN